jgi:hypothetical protein
VPGDGAAWIVRTERKRVVSVRNEAESCIVTVMAFSDYVVVLDAAETNWML